MKALCASRALGLEYTCVAPVVYMPLNCTLPLAGLKASLA